MSATRIKRADGVVCYAWIQYLDRTKTQDPLWGTWCGQTHGKETADRVTCLACIAVGKAPKLSPFTRKKVGDLVEIDTETHAELIKTFDYSEAEARTLAAAMKKAWPAIDEYMEKAKKGFKP